MSQVLAAPSNCTVSSDNCVGLHAWVTSDVECERLCQGNMECARHRLVRGGEVEIQGGGYGDDSFRFPEKQIGFPSEGNILEDNFILISIFKPARCPPLSLTCATSSAPAPSVLLPTGSVPWAGTTS